MLTDKIVTDFDSKNICFQYLQSDNQSILDLTFKSDIINAGENKDSNTCSYRNKKLCGRVDHLNVFSWLCNA